MTVDMKYPEELKQNDMLRNLERLQTELKRRREGVRVKWINVKDRLPDKDAPYIVFIPTAYEKKPLMTIARYDPKGYGWSGIVKHWVRSITHWTDLPDWPEDYSKEVDND